MTVFYIWQFLLHLGLLELVNFVIFNFTACVVHILTVLAVLRNTISKVLPISSYTTLCSTLRVKKENKNTKNLHIIVLGVSPILITL